MPNVHVSPLTPRQQRAALVAESAVQDAATPVGRLHLRYLLLRADIPQTPT